MSISKPSLAEQALVPRGSDAWSAALRAADRYLKTVGVSIPYVRKQLVRAASVRLDVAHRSSNERVLAVRMLACVERVLCDRLGAKPGSDTTDPDTARRRFLFSINPTPDSQMRLLLGSDRGQEPHGHNDALVRIPTIQVRVVMPVQDVDFRLPPGMRRAAENAATIKQ